MTEEDIFEIARQHMMQSWDETWKATPEELVNFAIAIFEEGRHSTRFKGFHNSLDD